MKVAIEARARGGLGGVAHYVRELIEHLQGLREAPELTVLTPQLPDALVLPWLAWRAPQLIRQAGAAVAHFTKAAIPRKHIVPTVVTIYDVIPILFPQGQALTRRFYWPGVLQHAAERSDHIMTISEVSKRDIQDLWNIPGEKITVTPLAVDTTFFTPQSLPVDKSYILFLGTLEPRKNIPALLRAFAKIAAEIPHRLVLIGKKGVGADVTLAEISKLNLSNRVEYLGSVPQADLPRWYSGADLFVWPSIYEGWGFPPQEAMACGTPVLVSNGGSLPEVVGGAGEVVSFTTDTVPDRLHDSAFESQLAERMLQILSDAGRRERMRQAGLEHVKQFSWEAVAQKTMDVYTKLSAL
jgi:glycosyltransferase involved in cell wall biosynthesis